MGDKIATPHFIPRPHSKEPDRLTIYPGGVPQVNRMEDARRARDGEDCPDCGRRVVVDQTPSYVFKAMSICRCAPPPAITTR
jgi:hypothetical protein